MELGLSSFSDQFSFRNSIVINGPSDLLNIYQDLLNEEEDEEVLTRVSDCVKNIAKLYGTSGLL